MNTRLQRYKEALHLLGFRPLIIAVLVLFLTAGIATYAGIRIHNTEKRVLRQQGELYAKEAAMEYNRYLLTRTNIVTLVAYTVDELLASGADNEVIEQYLVDQTNTVIATLDPITTGIYGWINGEYLDGAHWVPDADYIPTERPWYTQTLESTLPITFIEPYLDVHTQTILMTVTSLLRDGVSVVAMDVSLSPIQDIIQQVSASTEDSQAFLLDTNGIVIAHSDQSQLGQNYLEEPDTVGGMVARRVLVDKDLQFDIDTDKGSYSVYVDNLEGNWYSVSMINADIWYLPLHNVMVAFFVIMGIAVILIIAVILRLLTHNLALRQLHSRIDQEEQRGKQYQALSETDRMTGLNDRVSGERKVQALLDADFKGMFLELDIDHFKSINDTYGHQTGDVVILAIADALRSTFRANDITIRMGGDEFGVFAVGIEEQKLGELIIGRLFTRIENLSLPELQGGKVTVSVGAVLCLDGASRSFSELYSDADSAMYTSKRTPDNSLTFAQPEAG